MNNYYQDFIKAMKKLKEDETLRSMKPDEASQYMDTFFTGVIERLCTELERRDNAIRDLTTKEEPKKRKSGIIPDKTLH